MPLSSYQTSYNGVTWGPGTDIQLNGVDGMRGMPTIRGGDQPQPRKDGSLPGMNFFDERIIHFQLEVIAPKLASFETVISNFANAVGNIQDPAALLALQFLLPTWAEARQLFVRPSALALPIDRDYTYNDGHIDVQFTAPDPLVYSSTLHTASSPLPSPTAGATFPMVFSMTFGSSTGGSISATNGGNYPSPPLFSITGPVTNPKVALPSGVFFGCNLILGVSDVLVIDMANQLVTLNGADRYNTVMNGSDWFALPAGTTSIDVESTDAAPVASVFTCLWRDAWGTL